MVAESTDGRRLHVRHKLVQIDDLAAHATDLPALLKQFRAQFGAGGTIRDGCIELQGDHRDKVAGVLRQMGYPAKPSGA